MGTDDFVGTWDSMFTKNCSVKCRQDVPHAAASYGSRTLLSFNLLVEVGAILKQLVCTGGTQFVTLHVSLHVSHFYNAALCFFS
jgi:hypothetical protein